MRWAQIEPDNSLAERIIEAAIRDSQTALPAGQVRKMAQGWLTERRWEDISPTQSKSDPSAETKQQKQELLADIAHLQRMADLVTSAQQKEPLLNQIETAKAKLRTLQAS